jgi:hypothetical protein
MTVAFIFFAYRNKQKDHKRKREKDGDDEVDVEVNYEERALELEPKRTKHLLPIKTKGGLVYRSVAEDFKGMKIVLY